MRAMAICMLTVAASASLVLAADFPQWRGPARDGIAPAGPPLAGEWPKAGPPKLWVSEQIPEGGEGGFSGIAVADGRACVYCNWKYRDPFPQRKLDDGGFRRLGGFDQAVPEDLMKAAEKDRVSDERAAIKDGKVFNEWYKKWEDEHLKDLTDDQKKKIAPVLRDRLWRGKNALSLELLEKLKAIRDKEFPNQEALNKWYDDNGVSEAERKAVGGAIPTFVEKAWDIVFCLSMADGKTLWKNQTDGKPFAWSDSPTPTVAGGRVYILTSAGELACMNAADGKDVWRVSLPTRGQYHSSVLVADGKVVALAGKLKALSADKGELLWEQPKVAGTDNSPMLWTHGGKQYVICNTASSVHCVDLADGKLLWSAPGGGQSSPIVVGDTMVVVGSAAKAGTAAYRLTPEKAEPLWCNDKLFDGATSPLLYDGFVYVIPAKQAACIELATGKVAWEQALGAQGWTSPVVADGKLFALIGKQYVLIEATGKQFIRLAAFNPPLSGNSFSSPTVLDGKLLIRLANAVGCYDISAAGVKAAMEKEAAEKPAEKPAK